MSATLRVRSYVALSLMLAGVLVASMFAFSTSADAATRRERIRHAVNVVVDQKGDPYKYGAEGPRRFDCSGLIYYSYRKAGFTNIPRSSSQQARFADRISKKHMRRGDLMFFYDSGGVYHVGVFLGWHNGRRWMMHAPKPGERVHREKPWTSQWFAGTLR